MEILKSTLNGVVLISLSGNVMGGPEAVKLNEEINTILDAGNKKVILDLSRVERMNSSGLGILINALTTFKQNGGELKLACLSPRVAGLLSVTKLNSIFESFDSVDEALNAF